MQSDVLLDTCDVGLFPDHRQEFTSVAPVCQPAGLFRMCCNLFFDIRRTSRSCFFSGAKSINQDKCSVRPVSSDVK